jgi:uncharacterized protein YndB with AHSA1/START domain
MEPSTIHSTFVIELCYPFPPAKLFAAFSDPAKKRRWYAESDTHDVEQFEMDFRVGGAERTLYRFRPGTPFPGVALRNDGMIQEITPDQRVVTATTMSLGDHRISSSLITVEFQPSAHGTNLVLTHQGAFYEGSDGPKMREDGWRKILERITAALSE